MACTYKTNVFEWFTLLWELRVHARAQECPTSAPERYKSGQEHPRSAPRVPEHPRSAPREPKSAELGTQKLENVSCLEPREPGATTKLINRSLLEPWGQKKQRTNWKNSPSESLASNTHWKRKPTMKVLDVWEHNQKKNEKRSLPEPPEQKSNAKFPTHKLET